MMNPPSPALASYTETFAAIMAEAASLGTESVALAAAPGRVLATDIVAPFDLPRFDNTSVDGYAVHAADVERANRDGSVDLSLGLIVPAGEPLRNRTLCPGQTARVFTGSPLPTGTAAVVMQEDTGLEGESVRISAGISPGQCIRRQGEEFRCGDPVARGPQVFTPALCALAATMGLAQVQVRRMARVGLLLTGNELVTPGQPLHDAQIYESNGYGLAAALDRAGIASLKARRVPDTLESTIAALSDLLESNDVVITSGGVSVGAFDAVKEALQQLGVERRIWGVAIKPGKPFFFGVRHNNGRKAAVFGLPGNPLSALVTFSVFTHPYLRAIQGAPAGPRRFPAMLTEPLKKSGRRLEFVPVTITAGPAGWLARPLGQRASHMLGSFAQAEALVEFPAELEKLDAGQTIGCQFLPWSGPSYA